MNNTITPTTHQSMQTLLAMQQKVYRQIPGMDALSQATPEEAIELSAHYPNAAFALMVADNLFAGDWEQNEIHQKAYVDILNGKPIPDVSFRYDYDQECYMRRHMWD